MGGRGDGVSCLGLVGGAPLGERHCASPIHRNVIVTVLELVGGAHRQDCGLLVSYGHASSFFGRSGGVRGSQVVALQIYHKLENLVVTLTIVICTPVLRQPQQFITRRVPPQGQSGLRCSIHRVT